MSTPPFDVVGLGENSVDIVYHLPAWPLPGGADSKLRVSGSRVQFGGQVATTLCACAALGQRAAYIGAFGDDEQGTRLRGALDARGIDLSAALIRKAANRQALILIDDRDGERVVLWQRDPALTVAPHELRADVIGAARVLHVDALDLDASLAAARVARDAGLRVTSDVDQADAAAEQLIAAVTIPIVAGHVPGMLTGEADLERALRQLRQPHHELLCATLGARGAALLHDDRVHHVPGFPVQAADSTGAGDVFRGAFIAALLRGASPVDAVRFANAAAAVSCTRAGAIDSVPTVAEVHALLAGVRG